MVAVEFVIAGSDPAAAIVAGLLAQEHKKSVILIADASHSVRLPRALYLSFAVATRPETLAMASQLEPEGTRLLAKIAGRSVLAPVSPLVNSCSDEGSTALLHMFHQARHFGLEFDRTEKAAKLAKGSAFRMRRQHMVRSNKLWPALSTWLNGCGVQVLDAHLTTVTIHRDSTATIQAGEASYEAKKLILADSAALMQFGHRGDLEQNFTAVWQTSTLTEPAKTHEPVVLEPETGFSGWQRSQGTISITGRRAAHQIAALVERNISSASKLRRAGQVEYRSLISRDGAPVIGKFPRSGIFAVAGFGQFGLHMAPAIARHLAGVQRNGEEAYFHARSPGAQRARAGVADFAGSLQDYMADG